MSDLLIHLIETPISAGDTEFLQRTTLAFTIARRIVFRIEKKSQRWTVSSYTHRSVQFTVQLVRVTLGKS